MYTVCGKKHEVVYIPDAFAAVTASLPCVAGKDVKEHLLRLYICKSTGPDIWHPRAPRKPAGSFQNHVWETEEIPSDWITTDVVPIFKQNEMNNPGNCKSVSLTCRRAKIKKFK